MADTELHLYIHVEAEAGPQTIDLLNKVLTGVRHMAGELDALKANVARITDVDDSIIALVQGIKAKLDEAIANGSNPADLQALSDTLGAEANKVAAAVVENTPAA